MKKDKKNEVLGTGGEKNSQRFQDETAKMV